MKIAKHKIFYSKYKTKRKYRQIVKELRLEIADMLKEYGAVENVEAQQLASWDMFDQNASSSFFDSEWMFDVKDGFDIVIGNPPYVNAIELKKTLGDIEYKRLKNCYITAKGAIDLYVYFLRKD